ncbi:MAG: hypothetical protein BroJett021_29610 [Chloroflexota bacterium]|nr:MAG: hypothetical protein BroJett021_29610 [Chloroflexota bacterium]
MCTAIIAHGASHTIGRKHVLHLSGRRAFNENLLGSELYVPSPKRDVDPGADGCISTLERVS